MTTSEQVLIGSSKELKTAIARSEQIVALYNHTLVSHAAVKGVASTTVPGEVLTHLDKAAKKLKSAARELNKAYLLAKTDVDGLFY